MSITGIRNGVAATLSACGPFDASQISTCDFGILEQTAVCAILFFPGQSTQFEPQAYGASNRRDYRKSWDVDLRGYIKYDGNAPCLLARAWQMHDDICEAISSDDSLNGSASAAALVSMSYNPDLMYEAWGHQWAMIKCRLVAEE